MNKISLIAMLFLSGCGSCQRTAAHWRGYTDVCVDGVTYLQFPTGTVAKLNLNGTLVGCE